MARKKIREYDAKKLIKENATVAIEVQSWLVGPETNLENVPEWMRHGRLVVKPDQLFGKRKKHGLVIVGVDWTEARKWIEERRGKEITIGKATDVLTHFLIEPFVPHEQEYYVAFKSERDNDMIYFSEQGGIDIEENWENVIEVKVPVLENIDNDILSEKIKVENNKEIIIAFIKDTFRIFRELDFTYLEFNPFTIQEEKIHLLDAVARVDDCASFKNMQKWNFEFPREFGKRQFPEEDVIDELNRQSGSAIKLTMLNPQGEIWTIFAGGGASMIFLDMITNVGKGMNIANYSDISGNTFDESYNYAKVILELMIRNNGKVLMIAGGIANFTDIKETYGGFAKAITEYADKIKEKGIATFIRRGGPHYEEGLQIMRDTSKKLGLPIHVHGPETTMPEIIQIARESL